MSIMTDNQNILDKILRTFAFDTSDKGHTYTYLFDRNTEWDRMSCDEYIPDRDDAPDYLSIYITLGKDTIEIREADGTPIDQASAPFLRKYTTLSSEIVANEITTCLNKIIDNCHILKHRMHSSEIISEDIQTMQRYIKECITDLSASDVEDYGPRIYIPLGDLGCSNVTFHKHFDKNGNINDTIGRSTYLSNGQIIKEPNICLFCQKDMSLISIDDYPTMMIELNCIFDETTSKQVYISKPIKFTYPKSCLTICQDIIHSIQEMLDRMTSIKSSHVLDRTEFYQAKEEDEDRDEVYYLYEHDLPNIPFAGQYKYVLEQICLILEIYMHDYSSDPRSAVR